MDLTLAKGRRPEREVRLLGLRRVFAVALAPVALALMARACFVAILDPIPNASLWPSQRCTAPLLDVCCLLAVAPVLAGFWHMAGRTGWSRERSPTHCPPETTTNLLQHGYTQAHARDSAAHAARRSLLLAEAGQQSGPLHSCNAGLMNSTTRTELEDKPKRRSWQYHLAAVLQSILHGVQPTRIVCAATAIGGPRGAGANREDDR
ncbi:hypothetical protein CC86DRAFT_403991 [Ophiobolus disseminans]|uniref:Uncharacterized protein n=1 Tax=Ophiobolus disseminans TaxID=1469910 RepID=A0A6A7A7T6_9PLEO|nr:hypothetical protein CC86DRAFT_403991 [Ophiobolus disseminans]